jgi:hypothetical protein
VLISFCKSGHRGQEIEQSCNDVSNELSRGKPSKSFVYLSSKGINMDMVLLEI